MESHLEQIHIMIIIHSCCLFVYIWCVFISFSPMSWNRIYVRLCINRLNLRRLPYRMLVLKTKKYDYRLNSVALNSDSLLHLLSPRTVVHVVFLIMTKGERLEKTWKVNGIRLWEEEIRKRMHMHMHILRGRKITK